MAGKKVCMLIPVSSCSLAITLIACALPMSREIAWDFEPARSHVERSRDIYGTTRCSRFLHFVPLLRSATSVGMTLLAARSVSSPAARRSATIRALQFRFVS